eukprot:scaffold39227_cov58-Phaeocystis_antarctica.AAC.2
MVATVGGLEERECCVHARALVTWRDHEQEWSPGRRVHGRGAWHALVRWVGAWLCGVRRGETVHRGKSKHCSCTPPSLAVAAEGSNRRVASRVTPAALARQRALGSGRIPAPPARLASPRCLSSLALAALTISCITSAGDGGLC